MKLENRTALVTGGASGIGRGIAACLAEEGARVAIADINLTLAQEAAASIAELGFQATAVQIDVRVAQQVNTAVQQLESAWGPIDILVNNAGVGGDRIGPPFTNLRDEDWDMNYEVNLRGIFFVCRAVMEGMKERGYGKIINISSIAGKEGSVALPAYSSVKAGVVSFTQALARELGRFNINVNAICPGLIWTPMWEHLASMIRDQNPRLKDKSTREIFLKNVEQTVPLRREQTPEDMGKLAVFLASEDAKNITGQAINVCGGMQVH